MVLQIINFRVLLFIQSCSNIFQVLLMLNYKVLNYKLRIWSKNCKCSKRLAVTNVMTARALALLWKNKNCNFTASSYFIFNWDDCIKWRHKYLYKKHLNDIAFRNWLMLTSLHNTNQVGCKRTSKNIEPALKYLPSRLRKNVYQKSKKVSSY